MCVELKFVSSPASGANTRCSNARRSTLFNNSGRVFVEPEPGSNASLSTFSPAAEQRMHATKVQAMDRRREDVRDSFLDMVDAENETAIQALETPLEVRTFSPPRVCIQ